MCLAGPLLPWSETSTKSIYSRDFTNPALLDISTLASKRTWLIFIWLQDIFRSINVVSFPTGYRNLHQGFYKKTIMSKPIDPQGKGMDSVISVEKESTFNDEATQKFIQDIRNGSEEAYYKLVTRETGRLKDYICRYLNNVADAEEATQEVFTYLWVNRHGLKFDTIHQLYKYLNMAAKSQALMILRDRKNQNKYRNHIHTFPGHFADSPDEIIEMKQSEQVLQTTLKNMPKIRFTVYDMKQNQGLSYDEIAMRLNISPATARKHFSLAIQDLKDELSRRS